MKEKTISSNISDELKELLSIRHMIKEYKKGAYLFREGDTVKGIYLIRSGKVQIEKITPDGRELTLRICGPGQLVGEVTIFSDHPLYMLDAKAIEDVVCIKIAIEDLEDALLENSKLAVAFMKWMGVDQQKTQTKFRDLMLHGKKGALYSTLIRLCNSYGVEKDGGILIDMALTNQELANFCGMTREVVNRLLSDLKKQGKVSIVEGKLLIRDIRHLKDEINCENCPISFCRID
ncbi:Crp/Fnr family transcriptional regulator [Planococcus shenhongbingii]|uniref:Crp/Fnr family transcriptional regulator n=1 Tax=Planococcus shenhongbingii TaxID=3058398 RepID=A0ABT8NBU3_9BACL|nr:Crp/Fnr family transcriptional regulator [Planococcus sp. N017]MDN7245350.1 Crp/Fnr family transcriptional regulator [Planococcus sp. N017]